MKVSLVEKSRLSAEIIQLLGRLVKMVPWSERRKAKADIVETLLGGHLRAAEDVFGWGRKGIAIGLEERNTGVSHVDNITNRRKPLTEEKFPDIERDIHALFDAQSQADARLDTTLRYLNASAATVRQTLVKNGYSSEDLPTERTISNLLNRMGFRLHTVQKTKPQKKRQKPA